MKLVNPRVAVPYIGLNDQNEPTRNWMNFSFNGTVDHRRLKRMVRKTLNKALGRHIHTNELRSLVHNRRIKYA